MKYVVLALLVICVVLLIVHVVLRIRGKNPIKRESPDEYIKRNKTEKFRFYIFIPLMAVLIAAWWFSSTGYQAVSEEKDPYDGRCDICGKSIWLGYDVYSSTDTETIKKNEYCDIHGSIWIFLNPINSIISSIDTFTNGGNSSYTEGKAMAVATLFFSIMVIILWVVAVIGVINASRKPYKRTKRIIEALIIPFIFVVIYLSTFFFN